MIDSAIILASSPPRRDGGRIVCRPLASGLPSRLRLLARQPLVRGLTSDTGYPCAAGFSLLTCPDSLAGKAKRAKNARSANAPCVGLLRCRISRGLFGFMGSAFAWPFGVGRTTPGRVPRHICRYPYVHLPIFFQSGTRPLLWCEQGL